MELNVTVHAPSSHRPGKLDRIKKTTTSFTNMVAIDREADVDHGFMGGAEAESNICGKICLSCILVEMHNMI